MVSSEKTLELPQITKAFKLPGHEGNYEENSMNIYLTPEPIINAQDVSYNNKSPIQKLVIAFLTQLLKRFSGHNILMFSKK